MRGINLFFILLLIAGVSCEKRKPNNAALKDHYFYLHMKALSLHLFYLDSVGEKSEYWRKESNRYEDSVQVYYLKIQEEDAERHRVYMNQMEESLKSNK